MCYMSNSKQQSHIYHLGCTICLSGIEDCDTDHGGYIPPYIDYLPVLEYLGDVLFRDESARPIALNSLMLRMPIHGRWRTDQRYPCLIQRSSKIGRLEHLK